MSGPSAGPLLQLDDVRLHYGAVRAVDGVTLAVHPGRRHALIGPNGAGKSTLFAVMAGTAPVTSGVVRYRGRDITRLPVHARARLGIAKTFQHSSLFDGLSAAENVALAVRRHRGLTWRLTGGPGAGSGVTPEVDRCLDQAGLVGRRETPAGSLSHGERRQLEVAVALALEPRLLLLDEPTAGMSAAESEAFVAMVRGLPTETTVMIVEHDLDVVFGLADRVTVLAAGRVISDGGPSEIRASQAVQDAYLGGPADGGGLT